MLFLFGNAQDAADMGAEVRRAAERTRKLWSMMCREITGNFLCQGSIRSEVQTSEIISRSSGATDCYFCRYPQKRPISAAVLFRRRAGRRLCGLQSKKRISSTADLCFETIGGTAVIARLSILSMVKFFCIKSGSKRGASAVLLTCIFTLSGYGCRRCR